LSSSGVNVSPSLYSVPFTSHVGQDGQHSPSNFTGFSHCGTGQSADVAVITPACKQEVSFVENKRKWWLIYKFN